MPGTSVWCREHRINLEGKRNGFWNVERGKWRKTIGRRQWTEDWNLECGIGNAEFIEFGSWSAGGENISERCLKSI
jgi:hypothetical protein